MATPEPPKSEPAKASASSLAQAGDRIRESAKWLIASFAAVGAILAAGLQLTGLGELSDERLAVALIGLAVAIVGVAIAIRAAGGVVTESFVTTKWLASRAPDDVAVAEIVGDKGLLGGFDSVQQLKEAYDAAINERRTALRDYYDDPADDTKRLKADAAQQWAKTLDQSQVHVLERASFSRLRDAYRKAARAIGFSAMAAALGITAFAWGANPPSEETVPVLIPSGTEVVVSIDEEDRSDLEGALGPECDLSEVEGFAVEAVGESYRVASVASNDCRAALFTVEPQMGKVIPTSVLAPEDPGSGQTAGR
jgi:hypothetical protein